MVYRSVRFSQRYSAVKAARKHRELDAVLRRGRREGTVTGRRERSSERVGVSIFSQAYKGDAGQ